MRKSKFVLAVLATTTAGIVTLAGSQAQARENAAPADVVAPAPAAPMFFAAVMRGATTDVPPADPDGRGVFVMRVQGNQVGFAMAWRNLAMPTASHVHLGAAGINGPVRIPFFGGLPANLTAVTGSVTVMDQALLDAIAADPAGFYANIHTTEFPAGAIRGQLRRLDHGVDLQRFLTVGSLISLDSGDQEIAGGDADGHAVAFVRTRGGGRVDFGITYSGIAPPTAGHIHQGAVGVNGGIVVPFFAAPGGLPPTLNGIAGMVTGVMPDTIAMINRNPSGFYTNLHNVEFPGGAVRGQLFRVNSGSDDDVADMATLAD